MLRQRRQNRIVLGDGTNRSVHALWASYFHWLKPTPLPKASQCRLRRQNRYDSFTIRLTIRISFRKIVIRVSTEYSAVYTKPQMANHFSALKRARQTERRTATNRANTSRLRTALRALRETIAKGDKQAAEQTYRLTVSALDKAVQKGTLHGNTAGRYKSRLGARVNAMK